MWNLIEYSDQDSGKTGSLWQRNLITDSNSFNFKARYLANTNERGSLNAEIALSLKYFSSFWRTIEMHLINCKINLILTWSANCVISKVNRVTTFAITDTKLYGPVVTLSTNDNAKLLQKLKSGFKRTINRNKYQLKVTIEQRLLIWSKLSRSK